MQASASLTGQKISRLVIEASGLLEAPCCVWDVSSNHGLYLEWSPSWFLGIQYIVSHLHEYDVPMDGAVFGVNCGSAVPAVDEKAMANCKI